MLTRAQGLLPAPAEQIQVLVEQRHQISSRLYEDPLLEKKKKKPLEMAPLFSKTCGGTIPPGLHSLALVFPWQV